MLAANLLNGSLVIASKDLSAKYPMTQYLMAPSGFHLKHKDITNWWQKKRIRVLLQSTVTKSTNQTNVALTHM